MGNVASEAAAARTALASRGIACRLAVVTTVSPAPIDELARLLADVPAALAVEAHYTVGGLGSLVAEVIAERNLDCRLVRCGVEELSHGTTGSQRYLYDLHALSAEKLVETALATLRQAP